MEIWPTPAASIVNNIDTTPLAPHELRVLRASDRSVVGATEVDLSGAVAGGFVYGRLLEPVTLAGNTAYYVVSREYAGGDWWYNGDTRVTTTGVVREAAAVWLQLSGSWGEYGGAGQSFVPVSFKYVIE